MASLDQWFGARDMIRGLYASELGRDIVGDPDALTNWLYHWREDRQSDAWIRDRIRESPEWQARQGHQEPADSGSRPPEDAGPPSPAMPDPPGGDGGFLEHATSTAIRPPLSADEMRRMLPARGDFRFPAPYGSRGIRVTNADDGLILPVGYSYWANINSHAGAASLLVFVGSEGGRPLFFRVHKPSGDVTPLGALLDYLGTGEGWYWSATQPTSLYLHEGPRLHRVDVIDRRDEVVLDISSTHPGCRIWQCHSSADDQVHSATVQRITDSGPYEDLGCVVIRRRGDRQFFAKQAVYDECQIDASGRWLVIKETFTHEDGKGHLDNRIIDLATGSERLVRDEDGAAGHSDCGDGVLIGENDVHPTPGALCSLDLASGLLTLDYHGTAWTDSRGRGVGMGHVSVRGNRALVSNANPDNLPRVNELVLVTLDGSLMARVLAPNLVDFEHGGWSDYDRHPKANLDPTGTWAAWTANAGSDRLDLFLVDLS